MKMYGVWYHFQIKDLTRKFECKMFVNLVNSLWNETEIAVLKCSFSF